MSSNTEQTPRRRGERRSATPTAHGSRRGHLPRIERLRVKTEMTGVVLLMKDELVVGEVDRVVLTPEQRRTASDHIDVLLVLLDLQPLDRPLDPPAERPEPKGYVELHLEHAPRRVPLRNLGVDKLRSALHDVMNARQPPWVWLDVVVEERRGRNVLGHACLADAQPEQFPRLTDEDLAPGEIVREHLVCVGVLFVQKDVVLRVEIHGHRDRHRTVDFVFEGEAMLHSAPRLRRTQTCSPTTRYARSVNAYFGVRSGRKHADGRLSTDIICSFGLSRSRPLSRSKT